VGGVIGGDGDGDGGVGVVVAVVDRGVLHSSKNPLSCVKDGICIYLFI
jgi:hypothetical protein